MKALSIHPYYACLILYEQKTIEVRTWKTDYRGDILICSTARKLHDTIPGHALCVVSLVDIVPFEKKHLEAACLEKKDFAPDQFAWILDNLHMIKPFEVKGKLSLWECSHDIEIFDTPDTAEEDDVIFKTYYEPLII